MLWFVYITLDPKGKLRLDFTKFLDVSLMRDEAEAGFPLKVVYKKPFATVFEATRWLKGLKKLSKKRRLAFVKKTNPDLLDLEPRQVPFTVWNPPDFEFPPDASGGVGAQVPRPPIRPRMASDAKEIPLSDRDFESVKARHSRLVH